VAALDKLVTGPSKAYSAVYGNELDSTSCPSAWNFKDCSGAPHLVYRNDWSLFSLEEVEASLKMTSAWIG